jgi:hypothetical protein
MGHAVEEAAGRKVGRAGSPCVVKASEGQDATKKGGLDRQDRAMKLCAVTRRPVARLAGKASPVRHGNNIGLDICRVKPIALNLVHVGKINSNPICKQQEGSTSSIKVELGRAGSSD